MFDECQQRLLEARQSIKKEDPMELFVQFRVGKALRMMRRLRDESSSSISDNNKISSQKITNNGNNVDGNHCNGIQQEMAVTVNGN